MKKKTINYRRSGASNYGSWYSENRLNCSNLKCVNVASCDCHRNVVLIRRISSNGCRMLSRLLKIQLRSRGKNPGKKIVALLSRRRLKADETQCYRMAKRKMVVILGEYVLLCRKFKYCVLLFGCA